MTGQVPDLTALNLASRTTNALRRAGITTVEQVRSLPVAPSLSPPMPCPPSTEHVPAYLCDVRRLGHQSLLTVLDALREAGMAHPQDADAREYTGTVLGRRFRSNVKARPTGTAG